VVNSVSLWDLVVLVELVVVEKVVGVVVVVQCPHVSRLGVMMPER
jgi:hypothetical protein